MNAVVLSLGTNSGDRALNMRRMETEVAGILEPPRRFSSLMETAHVGEGERPPYYNRLVRGGYAGSPRDLLRQCQAIERKLGRTREGLYAPRTADIDILLFGGEEWAEADLVIPHPLLRGRRFCLAGLAEIAGELAVPGMCGTIGEAAAASVLSMDDQEITIIEEPAGREFP
jgi:2-amino-4-hydroxy-6-hydroxymethyldihydropteridine diphosphokinase